MLALLSVSSGYNVAARPAVRSMRHVTKLAGGAARGGNPLMDITLEEAGEFGTTDFTMTFKRDGAVISPWHDIPLEAGNGLYNMLTEIPKMTLKKMEVDTKACGSPGRWV